MFENTFSYVLRFPCFAGIVFTHRALKLREFTHHLRYKVEFANIRGPADFSCCTLRKLKLSCELVGNSTDSAHFVADTAKFYLIHNGFQLSQGIADLQLLIFFIEEFRIR
ncbi:hypothetical protein D3C81_1335380 [compost metagenome]